MLTAAGAEAKGNELALRLLLIDLVAVFRLLATGPTVDIPEDLLDKKPLFWSRIIVDLAL